MTKEIKNHVARQMVADLKDRFEDFVTNDFHHLRSRVDWILWILILGTLMTIAVGLLK